jgi:hypothetical protein
MFLAFCSENDMCPFVYKKILLFLIVITNLKEILLKIHVFLMYKVTHVIFIDWILQSSLDENSVDFILQLFHNTDIIVLTNHRISHFFFFFSLIMR